jgi:predicted GIY-YIG superfamily endonuclease
MFNVYILRCYDLSIYVGCTHNLEERLVRHQRGEVKYTSSRLPIQVETYITFTDKYKAFEFERYLKSGSGRAFMNRHLLNK